MIVLLFIIILSILIGISLRGKIIHIQVEIPQALLPYYEWLISFPGLQQYPEAPSKENHSPYKAYQA